VGNVLDQQFYIQQFYQYAGYPKYNKYSNVYNACCPICREGKSWGKKKRLYYIVDKSAVCCHNCGWYSNFINWLIKVTGKTYNEIIANAGIIDITDRTLRSTRLEFDKKPSEDLPVDAINILNRTQLSYYKHNNIINKAVQFVVSRKLHTAVNRPHALYVSLVDNVHRNRLCIPFTSDGEVVHYQTRTVLDEDTMTKPKYLSKVNSERTLFNIDNVTSDIESIYITEGPLDAFFIKNGVAVAGIQQSRSKNFSAKQLTQLQAFPLHKRVWCLDSQYLDSTGYKKTEDLAATGHSVFIWPRDEGRLYKDFNDMCIARGESEISVDWLQEHTYAGRSAQLRLSSVRSDRN
jgi:hypothetical protein